jgi:probable F420-dependent oxidoreductase
MARPFRFSARMPELSGDAASWRDSLKKIEDLGFSTVAVPDHFTQGSVWEPFVTLMAAAGATATLRLLPLVAGNDYRHPVMLHKAAATVEALSDGRLELGIGAGWMISDYEAANIPYDEPGVRVSRMEETVQIVKGLFAEEPLTFEGRHYRISALEGTPKPVQKPHPPILIGGGGKRVLSIAAREADIISVNANLKDGAVGPGAAQSMSVEETDKKLGWIKDAAKKAGRSMDEIELQSGVFMMTITDSKEEADTAKKNLSAAFNVEADEVGDSPAVLIGSIDECIEKLEERRERWGMSYFNLPDPIASAPIVERLAGS